MIAKKRYQFYDKPRMHPLVAVSIYGWACGIMLILFTIVPGFTRFLFSLFAFYTGFNFFSKYDEVKYRVILIVLALVIYFFGVMTYVALAIINGWYIPFTPPEAVESE